MVSRGPFKVKPNRTPTSEGKKENHIGCRKRSVRGRDLGHFARMETAFYRGERAMTVKKRNRDDKIARTAGDPLFGSPLGRDALYDGVAFGYYLHRVVAKRLFKAGV